MGVYLGTTAQENRSGIFSLGSENKIKSFGLIFTDWKFMIRE